MAVVTPIFLLLLGGIVDFGFMFRSWEVATNAAREGARIGVLPEYDCVDGEGGYVESRVNAYLTSAGLTGATVDVATEPVVNGAAAYTSCKVTVSMLQPLPSLGIFTQFFGDGLASVPLAATSVMRLESQAGP